MEEGEELVLQIRLEVDEQISARDEIELAERGVLGHILDGEDHGLPDVLLDPESAELGLDKVPPQPLGGHIYGYIPPGRWRALAVVMASSSMSVPKIWNLQVRLCRSIYSLITMAMEYASSPVAHPGTQTRIV